MHVHELLFEVVNREGLILDVNGEPALPLQPDGNITPPEPWETGFKDTVIAYPGQVTRVRAQFNNPGQFVWHCHIVEHEDNEMMRPYRIGPEQPGQPMPMPHHHGGMPHGAQDSAAGDADDADQVNKLFMPEIDK
jgi:hypothetical protein